MAFLVNCCIINLLSTTVKQGLIISDVVIMLECYDWIYVFKSAQRMLLVAHTFNELVVCIVERQKKVLR